MPTTPATNSPDRLPSQTERRRTGRRPYVAGAFLSSPTGGEQMEVASVDLSKHGVRLSVRKTIVAGTYHRLEMGSGEQKIVREVRVLSCHAESDGTFHVHAEFC